MSSWGREDNWPSEIRVGWCRGWFGRQSAYMKYSEATGTADQFWPEPERVYIPKELLAERDAEIAQLREILQDVKVDLILRYEYLLVKESSLAGGICGRIRRLQKALEKKT
jgi:hypothetical protein